MANLESPTSRFFMKVSLSVGAADHSHMPGRLILYGDSSSRLLYLFKSCQVTLIFVEEVCIENTFGDRDSVSLEGRGQIFFSWLRQ